MGLAPYGNPDSQGLPTSKRKLTTDLVDIRKDGSIVLNMDYFEYATGLEDGQRREVGAALWSAPPKTGVRDFPSLHGHGAGHPAGDRGDCPSSRLHGAAIDGLQVSGAGRWRGAELCRERENSPGRDLRGSLDSAGRRRCGRSCGRRLCRLAHPRRKRTPGRMATAMRRGAPTSARTSRTTEIWRACCKDTTRQARHYEDFQNLASDVAAKLADGNVVGWFQGRMEFGRARSGHRSILGDARNPGDAEEAES